MSAENQPPPFVCSLCWRGFRTDTHATGLCDCTMLPSPHPPAWAAWKRPLYAPRAVLDWWDGVLGSDPCAWTCAACATRLLALLLALEQHAGE
jgi:hypothetical protein